MSSQKQMNDQEGEHPMAKFLGQFENLSLGGNSAPSSWAVKANNTYFALPNGAALQLVKSFHESTTLRHTNVMIQTESPIPDSLGSFYWELEIQNHADRDRCVAIGICSERADLQYLPGEPKSGAYGYHSDDGMIHDMTGNPKHSGWIFGTGDRVGCYVQKDGNTRMLRFTYNGEKIGSPLILGDNMAGPLHPCVGMYGGVEAVGTIVQANFQAQWNPNCRSLAPEDSDV